MPNYSYAEIAESYKLWCEYVDPDELTSEDDFNSMTFEEKVKFMIGCFGVEKEI